MSTIASEGTASEGIASKGTTNWRSLVVGGAAAVTILNGPSHCGSEQSDSETSNFHFPTSLGVSEVSERANKWEQRSARVKQAVWSKQMSERYEQTSKQVSEWPSIYVFIFD